MPSSATLPEKTTQYVPHRLHADDRTWPLSGGHVDVWVEVLHAQGLEPSAGLGFTLALDYEGDQFTSLGFPRADLRVLYGIEVHDLAVWRPLVAHAAQQMALGRTMLIETDAFFLPDTAGTLYRYEHVSTTIALAAIDAERERLDYFHGRGRYTLGGNDFAGVFRTGAYVADATVLPPAAEIAKLEHLTDLARPALVERATALARLHIAAAPAANPIARWGERVPRDIEWLRDDPRASIQRYAYVTVRQAGVCAELAASFLAWLDANGVRRFGDATDAFRRVAQSAKLAHLKLGRMARSRVLVDISSDVDAMVSAWDEAVSRVADHLAR
ncbi:MAG TPA: DUF1839 family protein [Gemmatimonadaceae bacterium]|nr:DUF1839 family protein [Gemmatimonadaceae bacterium]